MIRFLLKWLIRAAILGVFLGLIAFIPEVQTWMVQRVLDRRPAWGGTVGAVAIRPGKVDVSDLRFDFNGAILTVPYLEARLPVRSVLGGRQFLVRHLEAKGWTLDLTRRPATARGAPSGALLTGEGGGKGPIEAVAPELRGIFQRAVLPYDLSLDEVDLEGEILFTSAIQNSPVRVHVAVKGGAMGAGKAGTFSFTASTLVMARGLSDCAISAEGRLLASMNSPRTFNRADLKADFSVDGSSSAKPLKGSVHATVTAAGGGETYAVELAEGGRQLVSSVLTQFARGALPWKGTWKVDLSDADLAQFIPPGRWPPFSASGGGAFDADLDFHRIHLAGRLAGTTRGLGVLMPALERLASVGCDVRFDATQTPHSLRVDRLRVDLAGTRPIAKIRSLQPFALDEDTLALGLQDPKADWLEVSVSSLPLSWLPTDTFPFAFAGGDAVGTLRVRAEKSGFGFRSKGPFKADSVTVRHAGTTLGRDLDLALSWAVQYAAGGWKMDSARLAVASRGRGLLNVEATGSPLAGDASGVAIAGKWSADLDALRERPDALALGAIPGRSASGEFSGSTGATEKLEGKLVVAGHDRSHSLSAIVTADVDPSGTATFTIPASIAWGASRSDLTAEGSWSRDEHGPRIDANLSAKTLVLGDLRAFAGPLAAASSRVEGDAGQGRAPFWGGGSGRITLDIDRLSYRGRDWSAIGGTLDFDPRSIRLERGRLEVAPKSLANVEGAVSFDPAAALPYAVKVTGSVDRIDSALLFGSAASGQDASIEGRFSLAGSVLGNGADLNDLLAKSREEFRLTSTDAIVRLLRTSVADAIPEANTPVKDALGSVGSFVGSILGKKESPGGLGRNTVSKTAEAVIDFTNQVGEIGFDEFSVSGTRQADRTINLLTVAMTSKEERITGSGEITYLAGRPLRSRPVDLDLQFWAKGPIAKTLATAGLLSARTDAQGYTMLDQPILLGGTLAQIDASRWHDLLAKAAAAKSKGAK